ARVTALLTPSSRRGRVSRKQLCVVTIHALVVVSVLAAVGVRPDPAGARSAALPPRSPRDPLPTVGTPESKAGDPTGPIPTIEAPDRADPMEQAASDAFAGPGHETVPANRPREDAFGDPLGDPR